MKTKIDKGRVRALIRKDLKETCSAKMVILPMIAVPLIMAAVLPAIMITTIGVSGTGMMNGVQQIEKLIPVYGVPGHIEGAERQLLYIFLNYTFLPLFLIIPLMVSAVIAANAVVGEKERGTLETLLYSPVTNREFILGKLLAAFLPGATVAPIAFLLYASVSNILSRLFFGTALVGTPVWIPTLLLLSPAVSLLGLSVTLFVSLRAKSFMEAQQVSAMVVIPLVGLMIAQISGTVVLSMPLLLLISLGTLALDYLLVARLIPRFGREAILSRM